jgi:UDP-3-O-[3-hydroxymyristoyl] glucosamine N-acyltransferase
MLTIKQILGKIPHTKFSGNLNAEIVNIIEFDSSNKDSDVLMWVSKKNEEVAKQLTIGTLICSSDYTPYKDENVNLIFCDNPRESFSKTLKEFFIKKKSPLISASAQINENVEIGNNCNIGNFVVIEENCRIGNNCSIDHGTVIKSNTILKDNVTIGANCVIGGVGFGYEKNETGIYDFIPHIGNVIIENNVEIGNNTCIDRAVLGSTILKEYVKVDNLVHIAHGVKIGKNSLIIANAMIAGSVIIGENVWIAPSSSVLNKLSIDSGSTIGMGAVVIRPVKQGETIIGNPGKILNK